MRKGLIVLAVAALGVGAGGYVLVSGSYGRTQPGPGNGSAAAPAPQGVPASPQGARGGPAVPVEVANAKPVTTTADIRSVGSLQSDESVQIAPEIAGRVAEIAFKEGDDVKAGDVLVRLDDALVRAEVADAEARHELAKSNLARANTLSKTGNVTERARDEAVAAFGTASAALELARVRLSKHVITAPFTGVVGLRRVSAGAYVAIGAPIVNLEKIDELKVDFKIPEIYLARVRIGQTIDVTVDALPDRSFTGRIYAIDPMVDVNGRALQIRARIANPDRLLRPGLFARIVIKGDSERQAVMVPESAVVPRGGESYVYRIEQGKAVETKVRLGERRAGAVEIVEGLPADATVVTAGHQRLRNGATVDVVTPASQARG
jgi:membrane fusion protein (multidrug efflux system)